MKKIFGFTLIELMIVIAIIGILASIVGGVYQDMQNGTTVTTSRDGCGRETIITN